MTTDEFEPDDQSREDRQEFLYELIDFRDEHLRSSDGHIHDLFWAVMYDDELSSPQRLAFYDELQIYLADHYGLDFEDLWSWDEFRDWYEHAA